MLFKIELAKPSDMRDLFDLANDPLVRINSFNQENIALESHQKWFAQKLSDKNCYFYILRQELDFVGYARFDKVVDNEFVITLHLHKNFRGKGFGSKIISLVTKKVCEENKEISILAYVKKDNAASYKSFTRAGYKLISDNFIYKKNLCYLLKNHKI